MKKGFPSGIAALEQDAAYYNAAYEQSRDSGEGYSLPPDRNPMKAIIWGPALDLVEGPVLDLGCGPGHVAVMCVERGIEYLRGIDFSRVAVEMAKELVPSCKFQRADLVTTRGRFYQFRYRTALLLELLEHVYQDLRVLRRIPLGRVVVMSVPNFHTEGHARWFANEEQVRERYSPLLDIETVIVSRAKGSRTNCWFIVKGIRIGIESE